MIIMSEILLVRHAQSYANKRDFAAFGNVDSPLTEKGIQQAEALKQTFDEEFGIAPEDYDRPVLASTFTRAQQTAMHAGFRNVDISPLINESDPDLDEVVMSGSDVIRKHAGERWVPDGVTQRASTFLDHVRDGELNYGIYFSHGMFIAGVLLECNVRLIEVAVPFDEKRGYVPLQTAIIKLEV